MLYQIQPLTPVMTNDHTLNQRIFEQQAWMVLSRIELALLGDFVYDPKNGCAVYAPGWQKEVNLNDAYNDFFSKKGVNPTPKNHIAATEDSQ